MKKLFFILALLIVSSLSIYAANEVIIKLYMNDGSAMQIIDIADIGKISIKNGSSNYGLKIYSKSGNIAGYLLSSIDTMIQSGNWLYRSALWN